MKIADVIHLNKFKQPLAVDDNDGNTSTHNVVAIVRIQLLNNDPNPLVTNIDAKGAFTSIHQPYAI